MILVSNFPDLFIAFFVFQFKDCIPYRYIYILSHEVFKSSQLCVGTYLFSLRPGPARWRLGDTLLSIDKDDWGAGTQQVSDRFAAQFTLVVLGVEFKMSRGICFC